MVVSLKLGSKDTTGKMAGFMNVPFRRKVYVPEGNVMVNTSSCTGSRRRMLRGWLNITCLIQGRLREGH